MDRTSAGAARKKRSLFQLNRVQAKDQSPQYKEADISSIMNVSYVNNPESLNKSVTFKQNISLSDMQHQRRSRRNRSSAKKNLEQSFNQPPNLKSSPLKATFNPRASQPRAEEPFQRPETSHFGGERFQEVQEPIR